MNWLVFLLLFLVLVSGCTFNSPSVNLCITDLKSEGIEYDSGNILVTFNNSIPVEESIRIIESYGLRIRKIYDSLNIHSVIVPENQEIEWACRLREDSKVMYAEVNCINCAKIPEEGMNYEISIDDLRKMAEEK